jgi:uncharacterized tellurite resistance protein B-like protein
MSELAERFREYLHTLSDESGETLEGVSEGDLKMAMTVMLVQVLRADLQIQEEELEAVLGALQEILGLDRGEATALMRVAAHAARDSEGMRVAVERLDRHLNHRQRVQLVEWLWRIAFADAEILSQEEYLIRKISELLGLSTADIVEAKVRAKEAFGQS